MKTINLHNTQTKKAYKKPVLGKMGDIKKLTRGTKGGSFEDEEVVTDPPTIDYSPT